MKPPVAIAVIAASALLFAACADSGSADGITPSKETTAMSNPPTASRPPAPEVAPVEYNGIRYVQDSHDDREGDQQGGYLAALDANTGARLWRLKVYGVPDHRAAGVNAGGIYFRSMRLSADRSALEIENESGGIYRVDLAARTVTKISGPPDAASEALAPPKPIAD